MSDNVVNQKAYYNNIKNHFMFFLLGMFILGIVFVLFLDTAQDHRYPGT
jgi:hypothetical protein